MLDGPAADCIGAVDGGLRLPVVLDLRLRDLASEELLVEADMTYTRAHTTMT